LKAWPTAINVTVRLSLGPLLLVISCRLFTTPYSTRRLRRLVLTFAANPRKFSAGAHAWQNVVASTIFFGKNNTFYDKTEIWVRV